MIIMVVIKMKYKFISLLWIGNIVFHVQHISSIQLAEAFLNFRPGSLFEKFISKSPFTSSSSSSSTSSSPSSSPSSSSSSSDLSQLSDVSIHYPKNPKGSPASIASQLALQPPSSQIAQPAALNWNDALLQDYATFDDYNNMFSLNEQSPWASAMMPAASSQYPTIAQAQLASPSELLPSHSSPYGLSHSDPSQPSLVLSSISHSNRAPISHFKPSSTLKMLFIGKDGSLRANQPQLSSHPSKSSSLNPFAYFWNSNDMLMSSEGRLIPVFEQQQQQQPQESSPPAHYQKPPQGFWSPEESFLNSIATDFGVDDLWEINSGKNSKFHFTTSPQSFNCHLKPQLALQPLPPPSPPPPQPMPLQQSAPSFFQSYNQYHQPNLMGQHSQLSPQHQSQQQLQQQQQPQPQPQNFPILSYQRYPLYLDDITTIQAIKATPITSQIPSRQTQYTIPLSSIIRHPSQPMDDSNLEPLPTTTQATIRYSQLISIHKEPSPLPILNISKDLDSSSSNNKDSSDISFNGIPESSFSASEIHFLTKPSSLTVSAAEPKHNWPHKSKYEAVNEGRPKWIQKGRKIPKKVNNLRGSRLRRAKQLKSIKDYIARNSDRNTIHLDLTSRDNNHEDNGEEVDEEEIDEEEEVVDNDGTEGNTDSKMANNNHLSDEVENDEEDKEQSGENENRLLLEGSLTNNGDEHRNQRKALFEHDGQHEKGDEWNKMDNQRVVNSVSDSKEKNGANDQNELWTKDKGYAKHGWKNVYHKEEWGEAKKYHDIWREKDWKKKYLQNDNSASGNLGRHHDQEHSATTTDNHQEQVNDNESMNHRRSDMEISLNNRPHYYNK